jgi:hypothetical protein
MYASGESFTVMRWFRILWVEEEEPVEADAMEERVMSWELAEEVIGGDALDGDEQRRRRKRRPGSKKP